MAIGAAVSIPGPRPNSMFGSDSYMIGGALAERPCKAL